MNLRTKQQNPTTPPVEDTPEQEQGTVLNLRNPDQIRKEWAAEAGKSEQMAAADRETVVRLKAEAEQHQQQAGQAADEEMRLMQELQEARQRREFHVSQKDGKLGEARKVEDRARFHEDRAADLRDSIAALPARETVEQPLPAGVDPAGSTAVDLTDRHIADGVERFIGHHDTDPAGEAGAA